MLGCGWRALPGAWRTRWWCGPGVPVGVATARTGLVLLGLSERLSCLYFPEIILGN